MSRAIEDDLAEGRLDALDRELVALLRDDARTAYAALGVRLGVTGMTVANRLQRLRQAGLVEFRVVPNLDSLGFPVDILGYIQADISAHSLCTAALSASPFVLRIDRVTGEHDLAFTGAFPSETVLGTLIRDLQAISGVRRLVVHHRLESVKEGDGWAAVLAEPRPPAPMEIAPGVRVPEDLRPHLATSAIWVNAFVQGDKPGLTAVSHPDLEFTVLPPQNDSGVYKGLDAVLGEAAVAGRVYRRIWERIIGISRAAAPYDMVIDALYTSERLRGPVRTTFARMAFGFAGDRVRHVISLGSLEMSDAYTYMPPAPAAAVAETAS